MNKTMPLGKQLNVIFHDKQFAVMILKKCGSVTLHKTLLKSFGHTDLSGNNINKVFRQDFNLVNKYEIAKFNYTTTSWVRNPFDRLVSGWFNRIRNKKNAKSYGVDPNISFEDFALYICSLEDKDVNVHFHQQTFDIAIDGKLVPNRLIHLESLIEEWEDLRKEVPWLAPIKWREQWSKKKGDFKEYYKKDLLIEKVAQRFEQDLRLLGYTFEGII